MKVVIFDNPDGTITVRSPVRNPRPGSQAVRREKETLNQHFARLTQGPNRKGGLRVAEIDHTALPAGHEHFKAARKWNGAAVEIDMVKAAAIKTDMIREERDRRLRQADNDLTVAEDDGDATTQSAVRDRRRALRDLPATIQPALQAVATPTDLEAWQPPWPP